MIKKKTKQLGLTFPPCESKCIFYVRKKTEPSCLYCFFFLFNSYVICENQHVHLGGVLLYSLKHVRYTISTFCDNKNIKH